MPNWTGSKFLMHDADTKTLPYHMVRFAKVGLTIYWSQSL